MYAQDKCGDEYFIFHRGKFIALINKAGGKSKEAKRQGGGGGDKIQLPGLFINQ